MTADVDREMEVIPLLVVVARRGDAAARDDDLELALVEEGDAFESARHPAAIARRSLSLVRCGGDESSTGRWRGQRLRHVPRRAGQWQRIHNCDMKPSSHATNVVKFL